MKAAKTFKGSISPSFYKQLLHSQIPRAQKKDSQDDQLFALSGPVHVKAAHRHVDEIDPRSKLLWTSVVFGMVFKIGAFSTICINKMKSNLKEFEDSCTNDLSNSP